MKTTFRGVALICAALLVCPVLADAAAKETKAQKTSKEVKAPAGAANANDVKEPKDAPANPDATTSYRSFKYDASTFEGSAKQAGGRPFILKGAVVLTLVPEDPSQKPLVMHAAEATIVRDKTDNSLETMELKGKVSVDGDMGTVTSDHALMAMKTRNVTFTGNVVFNLSMGKGEAESLTFNMDTQDFQMTGRPKGEFQLRDDATGDKAGASKGKTADPSLLGVGDITDWSGLISKIQEQAKGSAPAPGKQIMSLLSAKARGQFTQIPAAAIPDSMKSPIVGQLNGVIRNPKLYNAEAWDKITLDEEVNALLRRPPPLQPAETARLNRLLLEAAYPNTIAHAKKAE